jgi:prepilin peptidase CpaA
MFVPFALGGLGGGDVKLLAALGAWVGPVNAIWVGLYAGTAGAVMALLVALYSGYTRQALSNVWLLLQHWRVAGIHQLKDISLEGSSGPRLAYALPIFAGLLITTWLH